MPIGRNIGPLWYAFKQGKIKQRSIADNPLVINIKNAYHKTPPGKLSLRISEYSHKLGQRLGNWIAYKINIYSFKR